jgi:hypothetical protein
MSLDVNGSHSQDCDVLLLLLRLNQNVFWFWGGFCLEQICEKWMPVFGMDRASTKLEQRVTDFTENYRAPIASAGMSARANRPWLDGICNRGGRARFAKRSRFTARTLPPAQYPYESNRPARSRAATACAALPLLPSDCGNGPFRKAAYIKPEGMITPTSRRARSPKR